MSTINKYIKLLFCFFLVLATFITIVDINCFNKAFYKKEYIKFNTVKDVGVSESDLFLMTDDLLDYLKGNKPDLSLEITHNGNVQQAFNEREIIHMSDVKDLYDKVIIIRNVCFVVAVCLLLYCIIRKDFNNYLSSYKKTLYFFGGLFSIIGMFCLIDFNSFWINFHKVFFTKNDYWLLDPNTSLLINMVPEQFFFDLCIRIVIEILILLVIYFFVFKIIDKKGFKK